MATTIYWDLPTERTDGSPLTDLKGTVVSVYDKSGSIVGGQPVLVPAPRTSITFVELGLPDGVYTVEVQAEDSAGLRSVATAPVPFRVGAVPAPKSPTNVRVE